MIGRILRRLWYWRPGLDISVDLGFFKCSTVFFSTSFHLMTFTIIGLHIQLFSWFWSFKLYNPSPSSKINEQLRQENIELKRKLESNPTLVEIDRLKEIIEKERVTQRKIHNVFRTLESQVKEGWEDCLDSFGKESFHD